jgi:ribose/xylose/arabinose/galactoside ABC-type transport system permease subunit
LSSLEDKLRPQFTVRPMPRDALVLALLLALAAVLLPVYGRGAEAGLFSNAASDDDTFAGQIFYLNDIAGQMASFYLLPALGFALALRCGAIDLSAWITSALGGVVAAAALNHGIPLVQAFTAAVCAGLVVGAVNGLLVARLRWPSVLVTVGTACGVMVLLQTLVKANEIAVPPHSFLALEILPFPPLLTGRMLIVAGGYAAVMLLLCLVDMGAARRLSSSRRWQTFGALAASGALGGLAGACWLIDSGKAPVPTFPIGDLRVPAAAILAGAALLGGRGRTLIVGVALPPAMLVATAWRQEIWSISFHGIAVQMILLIAMTLVAHRAILGALAWKPGQGLAIAASVATASSLLVLAGSAGVSGLSARLTFHLAALALFVTGTFLLLLSRANVKTTLAQRGGNG